MGEVHITEDITGNEVYVAFYPGQIRPLIFVRADGKLYKIQLAAKTVKAGKFMSLPLNMKETKDVVIDNVKWACGNLQYDNGTWKVADNQWETFAKFHNMQDYYDGDGGRFEYFTYGSTSQDKRKYSSYTGGGEIVGKLFKDAGCTIPGNFSTGEYGDIAYKRTNGAYTLPSQGDYNKI